MKEQSTSVLVDPKKLIPIFSLITGEISEIESDEYKTLDEYQVPLKKRFPQACNNCYGRGYSGHFRDVVPKDYEGTIPTKLKICHKCMSRCIDLELIKKIEEFKKQKQAEEYERSKTNEAIGQIPEGTNTTTATD